ncbi:hypothetical protein C483_02680 [Natrialba hulunbeirensis JCM 10989]|uniref:Uncharacterized protein n=1 Tax=Natrialba hulunbeirensis JCM 10989 TaxID=1227493 RepID=M0A8A9_9EURY|nr:hypothetical protein C483_02680 [Natrialba hulunbeirensis JCM 10989]
MNVSRCNSSPLRLGLEIEPDPQLEREADEAAQQALSDDESLIVSRMGADVHIQRADKTRPFSNRDCFDSLSATRIYIFTRSTSIRTTISTGIVHLAMDSLVTSIRHRQQLQRTALVDPSQEH